VYRYPVAIAIVVWSYSLCSAAEPTDIADLFPAGTLAYAEVTKPAATADVIAALVKGTLLADSLGFTHDRRDKIARIGQMQAISRSSALTLFMSPEALAELKRIRGAALGLTGFDPKTGAPQFAFVILTGESNALGLLARTYLLTSSDVRRVGKVDDVAVYQNRAPTGGVVAIDIDEHERIEKPIEKPVEKPAEPQVVAEGQNETTYLYAPGLIVVGSSKSAVADVYRRFRANLKMSPALGSSTAFAQVAELRKQPGVVFFAQPPAFEKAYDQARSFPAARIFNAELFAFGRFLLVPKQIPILAGRLDLASKSISLTLTVEHQDPASSPFMALLASPNADATRLRLGIPGQPWGATVTLPAKENRAATVLAFCDAIAKSQGKLGPLPSEIAKESAKDSMAFEPLLATVSAVTLSQPSSQQLPKNVPNLPLMILHLEDEAAAKKWESSLPKLCSILTSTEAAEPTSETIGNVKVLSLIWRMDAKPAMPVHFVRAGSDLVFGLDRKQVAAVVASEASVKSPVETTVHDASILGYCRSQLWLEPLLVSALSKAPQAQQTYYRQVEPRISDTSPLAVRVRANLTKALATVPPLAVRLSRKEKSLRVELSIADVQPALPKVVEAWLIWLETMSGPVTEGPMNPEYPRIQDR